MPSLVWLQVIVRRRGFGTATLQKNSVAPRHLGKAHENCSDEQHRLSVRVTRRAGSGQHLASVLQEGRKNANIDAGLGFIWRILSEGQNEP
jgi:hypothetical protein